MPVCYLHALSGHAPDSVVTNDDLAKFVDTTDEWIVERTGIKTRHRLGIHENASCLGLAAATKCLQKAGISPSDLTHVIAATCTPDYLCPSISCIIAGKLNTGPAMAFDIGAACSGFIYGLGVCASFLAASPQSNILLICAEALTRRVNWKDRSTCVLFGDAAAATIVNSTPGHSLCAVLDVICESDGSLRDLVIIGGGTACQYGQGATVGDEFYLSMQGRDTYRQAVRQMAAVCRKILERNDLSVDDVDVLVPHQANMRIIEAVGSRLGIAKEKVFVNLAEYGNTSAASIPLALTEAVERGFIPQGSLALVTAFGGGLTWGAALLKF